MQPASGVGSLEKCEVGFGFKGFHWKPLIDTFAINCFNDFCLFCLFECGLYVFLVMYFLKCYGPFGSMRSVPHCSTLVVLAANVGFI